MTANHLQATPINSIASGQRDGRSSSASRSTAFGPACLYWIVRPHDTSNHKRKTNHEKNPDNRIHNQSSTPDKLCFVTTTIKPIYISPADDGDITQHSELYG